MLTWVSHAYNVNQMLLLHMGSALISISKVSRAVAADLFLSECLSVVVLLAVLCREESLIYKVPSPLSVKNAPQTSALTIPVLKCLYCILICPAKSISVSLGILSCG